MGERGFSKQKATEMEVQGAQGAEAGIFNSIRVPISGPAMTKLSRRIHTQKMKRIRIKSDGLTGVVKGKTKTPDGHDNKNSFLDGVYSTGHAETLSCRARSATYSANAKLAVK